MEATHIFVKVSFEQRIRNIGHAKILINKNEVFKISKQNSTHKTFRIKTDARFSFNIFTT